jgi:hypothetical protein
MACLSRRLSICGGADPAFHEPNAQHCLLSLTLRESSVNLLRLEMPTLIEMTSWLSDGKIGGLASVGRSVALDSDPRDAPEKIEPTPSSALTSPATTQRPN